MPTWCCVPNCFTDGGHKFPKDKDLREKWVAAINRDGFQPSKYSKDPDLQLKLDSEIKRTNELMLGSISRSARDKQNSITGDLCKRQLLQKGSVPRLFNQIPKPKLAGKSEKLTKILPPKSIKNKLNKEVNDNDSMDVDSEILVKFEIEDPDLIGATLPIKTEINGPEVLTKFEANSADLLHLEIKLEPKDEISDSNYHPDVILGI